MTGHRWAFDLLALICVVTVFIGVFTVSDARLCDDYSGIRSAEDNDHYCCKTKRYIDREETSQFYCEGGCCGERNEEYCCHYINEKALPYVIGFSIFGVVVVVVVAIIMFFVLRRACRGYREYKQHQHVLTETYAARTLQELRGSDQLPMEEGAVRIVHPVTVVGEPGDGGSRGNTDSLFTVPGPDHNQPPDSRTPSSRWSPDTTPSAGARRDYDYHREGETGVHGGTSHQHEYAPNKYAIPPPSYEEVVW